VHLEPPTEARCVPGISSPRIKAARVQSLFEQVRLAKSSTKSAAETLRMTRERKELGVGIVLEDIQAQQELIRARSDHVASVTELNQEQFALLRSKAEFGQAVSNLRQRIPLMKDYEVVAGF
jgi:outer membrane protein TolC